MSENPNSSLHQSQSHTRINNTLLGSIEKKALLWLSAHLPAWIVPDTMTLVGLGASILIFISYALTTLHPGFLWLASLGFLFQWLGDSMDGTLARFRKIERPRYGFFVDHIIDSLSEVLIFLGLGFSPYLRFDFALVALCSYLLLATYVYLVTYVNGVFRISYARLGPTETRVLAIIANTVVFFTGNPVLHININQPFSFTAALTFYDFVAVFFTALVSIFFIYSSITTAMNLSREDRIAARDARRMRSLQKKSTHEARRQSLRDERAMRKTAAQAVLADTHPDGDQ